MAKKHIDSDGDEMKYVYEVFKDELDLLKIDGNNKVQDIFLEVKGKGWLTDGVRLSTKLEELSEDNVEKIRNTVRKNFAVEEDE